MAGSPISDDADVWPLRLRQGLDIQPSGQDWTVSDPGGRIFRVSADIAALLHAIDGSRTPQELSGELTRQTGRRWTTEAVDRALASFAAKGFIDNGENHLTKPPRVRFVPPLTLQIGLFSPASFLDRIRHPLQRLISTPMVLTYVLIITAGIIVLAVSSRDTWDALTTPLPLATYLAVIAAMMLSTMLHEMGHGATLAAFGGKPRQIGFMLFYLTPAFFCDVSDGWRLDSKAKRVSIALAGIITQGTLAGTASLLSMAVTNPELRAGLLVYAVLGYTSGIVNLVPFVKLDGYIALMSYLDISHLRDKALRDSRRYLSRLFFGHATGYELPPLRGLKLYGLLCMIFPAFLIFTALSLWLDVIAKFGGWGALVALVIVLLVMARVLAGYLNIAKEGWQRQRSRIRILGVSSLAAALVAVSAAYIRIPTTIQAGFVNDAQGPGIVFDGPNSAPPLRAGQVVDVYASGLIGIRHIGSTTVDSAERAKRPVRLDTLAPVTWDGIQLNATVIPLSKKDADKFPASGTVHIHLDGKNAYEWFNEKYLQPALASLLTSAGPGQ